MADYENLPNNSHQFKEDKKALQTQEKRATKVVRGPVKTKKNEIRKFTDIFIAEDIGQVKEYIVHDVLIPSLKNAFFDVVVGGLKMSLFGGRGSDRRTISDKVSFRDYNRMSRDDDYRRDRDHGRGGERSVFDYDDIILDTRGEAELVLERMDEIMEEYRLVRVADLYDLVGVSGPHTANNYGWTNIRNAKVVPVRDGFMIRMPKALPIR